MQSDQNTMQSKSSSNEIQRDGIQTDGTPRDGIPRDGHPLYEDSEDLSRHLMNAADDVYEALIDVEDDEDVDEDVLWLREQRKLSKTIHWSRRPSLMMICSTIFILTLSLVMGEPTRQSIAYTLACNYVVKKGNSEYCDAKEVSSVVSNLELGYTIVRSSLPLLASTVFGKLSDIYGRKPPMVFAITTYVVGCSLTYCALYYWNTLHFSALIMSMIVSNLGGGPYLITALADCYISDITEPHERTYALGLGLASLFMGSTLGPILGNLATPTQSTMQSGRTSRFTEITSIEYRPIRMELLISFFGLMFCIFVVPESRSEKAKNKSRKMSMSRSNKKKIVYASWQESLVQKFKVFISPLSIFSINQKPHADMELSAFRKERICVLLLILTECMVRSVGIAISSLYVLYGLYKLEWTSKNIGTFLSFTCGGKAIVLIVLSPLINHNVFQKFFRFKTIKSSFDMVDFCMVALGAVCEAIGLIWQGLSPNTPIFLMGILFTSFGIIVVPTLGSSIVKFFPESKIGEVYGALVFVRNAVSLIAPPIFFSIYKLSLNRWDFPQAVFFVFGGFYFCCALIVLSVKRFLGITATSGPEPIRRSYSIASLRVEPSESSPLLDEEV